MTLNVLESLTLIKLGGSVITDKKKKFVSKDDNILRLVKEVKEAKKKIKGEIILGHGAGSFAHTPAKKYQTKKGIINKDSLIGAAIVEEAAKKLNATVVNKFISQGIPVMPFSALSFLISDALVYRKSYLDPLKNALEVGLVPVVYGDVVMDKKTGVTIFSTEKIFAVLAKELRKKYKIRLIYCSDVNGVYDEDRKTIPSITSKNFAQLKRSIVGARGIDVTGGMLHKVEEALKLASRYNIETLIINGNIKGNLIKALLNQRILSTRVS